MSLTDEPITMSLSDEPSVIPLTNGPSASTLQNSPNVNSRRNQFMRGLINKTRNTSSSTIINYLIRGFVAIVIMLIIIIPVVMTDTLSSKAKGVLITIAVLLSVTVFLSANKIYSLLLSSSSGIANRVRRISMRPQKTKLIPTPVTVSEDKSNEVQLDTDAPIRYEDVKNIKSITKLCYSQMPNGDLIDIDCDEALKEKRRIAMVKMEEQRKHIEDERRLEDIVHMGNMLDKYKTAIANFASADGPEYSNEDGLGQQFTQTPNSSFVSARDTSMVMQQPEMMVMQQPEMMMQQPEMVTQQPLTMGAVFQNTM